MRNKIIASIFCAVVLLLCCSVPLSEAFKLPDTGQTKCYNTEGTEISCAGTGQDGAYNVNPMSFTDNGNGTVTDNNTGLVWQKEDDNQTYNWYQASGTYDATYNSSSQNVCGTLSLGGHSDWRLPSKKELMSIVDYSVTSPGPTINSTYFPNTNTSNYWTSAILSCYPGNAWGVEFWDGNFVLQFKDRNSDMYVRCVRGEETSPSFTNNGNGTVTDARTGLVWQQGEAGSTSWESALSYCEGLTLGGDNDWRLPNIKELESLTDDTRYQPAIDTIFFPNANAAYYWASTTTTEASRPNEAYFINFYEGALGFEGKNNENYVRCVRGGQSVSLGNSPVGVQPFCPVSVKVSYPLTVTVN
ncbi:MAG: DUF1566 domain-containing protein, partial [Nitrospirota bacterium]|nr:DUF1566 domain-containing protein [Nitrospirota bacterium]